MSSAEQSTTSISSSNDRILILCPYCNLHIEILISEINCGIFRHGYDMNGNQINPHLSEELIDSMLSEKRISMGCGKQFKLIKESENYIALQCTGH